MPRATRSIVVLLLVALLSLACSAAASAASGGGIAYTLNQTSSGLAALTNWVPDVGDQDGDMTGSRVWVGPLDLGSAQFAAGFLDGDSYADAVVYTQRGRTGTLYAYLTSGGAYAPARQAGLPATGAAFVELWQGPVSGTSARIACGDVFRVDPAVGASSTSSSRGDEVFLVLTDGLFTRVLVLGSSPDLGPAASGRRALSRLRFGVLAGAWSRSGLLCGASQAAAGDVDGDGAEELVTLAGRLPEHARLEVWQFAGSAAGARRSSVAGPEAWWSGRAPDDPRLAMGDVNQPQFGAFCGDGLADALLLGGTQRAREQLVAFVSDGAAFSQVTPMWALSPTLGTVAGFGCGDVLQGLLAGWMNLGWAGVQVQVRGGARVLFGTANFYWNDSAFIPEYRTGLIEGRRVRLAVAHNLDRY